MTREQARAWNMALFAGLFDVEVLPSTREFLRTLTIPESVSPTHPGAFNPDVQPLATLVYDWFDDLNWRELIIVKGSQGGLSQAAQNLMCKIGKHKMGDLMMVLESAMKSKDLGNERVKEMLRANLRAMIDDERDQLQNRVLKVNGMRAHLAGARTAGGVASRTLRYIFGDEVDEWLVELQGGESNALDLLRERTKLVEDAKLLFFSKPRSIDAKQEEDESSTRRKKRKDDGIIWAEYLGGSRHKCCITCPHCWCDEHFELVWRYEGHRYQMAHCGQVRFDHCRRKDGISWDFDKMLEETHIVCPTCKRPIYDDQKVEMVLKHRKWIPTNDGNDENPPVPRRMSAHMSDLYANSREFPTLRLGQLAINCVSAKTLSARRAFRRGTLGLPIERNAVAKMEVEPLRRLCGKFPRGTCPVEPFLCSLQIDVQEHGKLFKWAKLATTLEDEAFVLDYGATEFEDEIAVILSQHIGLVTISGEETGEYIQCVGGWIDEGDGLTTNMVLDLCVRPGLLRRLSTCKGRGGRQTEHMLDRVVLQENRTHKGQRVDRYLVDDGYFKDDLYEERLTPWKEHLRKLARGEDTVAPEAPRIWFFEGAPDELLEEFCTESKCDHVRNGKIVFGWPLKPEGGGKNDWADCVKDGLALHYRRKLVYLKKLAQAEALAAATQEEATDGA